MFNQQKARWMMLGWLGRCKHLTRMATGCNFAKKEGTYDRMSPFFTMSQRDKLNRASTLISEVLEEIRNSK